MRIVCGGSPLMPVFSYECILGIVEFTCRGDSQGGVIIFLLSFSPLWTGFDVLFGLCFFNLHVGEIHRVDNVYTLVLPSVSFLRLLFWFLLKLKMSGRFTGRSIFLNSHSPLYETKNRDFTIMSFSRILTILHLYHGLCGLWYVAQWPDLLYVYI